MRRDKSKTICFSIPEALLVRLDHAYEQGDEVSRSAIIVDSLEQYLAEREKRERVIKKDAG